MSGCTNCGEDYDTNRSKTNWWNCKEYFGISGHFCGECYEMISHDAFRQPKHPKEYLMMLLRLSSKQPS